MTPNNDAQLRKALLGLSDDIATHHQPQAASTLWLRAQQRARRQAIARAALPLRIMHAFGILAAILAAAFALHQSRTAASPSAFSTLWIPLATVALVAGCATILVIGRHSNPAVKPTAAASH